MIDKEIAEYIDKRIAESSSASRTLAPLPSEPFINAYKGIKLLVATPTIGGLKYNYFNSALKMQGECTRRKVNCGFSILADCSLIPVARNTLVKWFLASDASHVLFIDDDIGWDPKDVFRMLDTGHPFVVGAVPLRRINKAFAADALKKGLFDVNKHLAEFNIALNEQDLVDGKIPFKEDGTIEIKHAGVAFALVRRDAIESIIHAGDPAKYSDDGQGVSYDLFGMYIDKKGECIGEDVAFCNRYTQVGGKIRCLVDMKLTHHGPHTFEGNFGDIIK